VSIDTQEEPEERLSKYNWTRREREITSAGDGHATHVECA